MSVLYSKKIGGALVECLYLSVYVGFCYDFVLVRLINYEAHYSFYFGLALHTSHYTDTIGLMRLFGAEPVYECM